MRKGEKENWNGEPRPPRSSAKSDSQTTRKLREVGKLMDSTTARKDLPDFLNDPENAQQFSGLVEDIRYALMDYQVCIPKWLVFVISDIRLRLRYNETSTTRAVNRS